MSYKAEVSLLLSLRLGLEGRANHELRSETRHPQPLTWKTNLTLRDSQPFNNRQDGSQPHGHAAIHQGQQQGTAAKNRARRLRHGLDQRPATEDHPFPTNADQPHCVLKRGDGGDPHSILNEYWIHRRLMDAQKTYKTRVLFPANFGLFEPRFCGADWPSILRRLPEGTAPTPFLGNINERIPSLPLPARRALVTRYCLSPDWEETLHEAEQRHVLARAYLGRRHPRTTQQEMARARRGGWGGPFAKHDFPLTLDKFEDLSLDPVPYAEVIADALALLLWVAKIDGSGVEFVLAPPRLIKDDDNDKLSNTFQSETLGEHSLWMLDFDACAPLSMDEAGVEVAARCFWRNEPYFPRPAVHADCPTQEDYNADARLWRLFRDRFLATSAYFLRDEAEAVRGLPELLVEKILERRFKYENTAVASSVDMGA